MPNTTISILNKNTFLFIVIVIIGSVLISIYMMVAPEKNIPYNFNPFPQQTPSALPDPSRQTDNCWNKLIPCDSSGQCSACSLGEYECKDVSKEQADNKYYNFNGLTVPEGKWCLPKDNNPDKICNMYTGRWLWTYDPEYCGPKNSGTQCWKCHCLYPNLFSGAEEGCMTPLACQNDSPQVNNLEQPGNYLIGSSCAKPSLQGQKWDPTSSSPPSVSDIYQYTPYDKDEDGNPLFVCNCSDSASNQYFSRLPGDPLTCHLEPCYKYLNSSIKGLTCSGDCNETCSGCSCNQTGFTKSPDGKFKNTCVQISQACNKGGYDTDTQTCTCGNGPFWSRKCKSNITEVNISDPTLPDCSQPNNALGSECINPCEGAQCNHGAPCISCGPDSWKGVGICNELTRNGPQPVPTVHGVCDCSLTQDKPINKFGGYYGPTCSQGCLGGGQVLQASGISNILDAYPKQSCSCCCALSSTYTSSLWGILSYEETCNDGYPSPEQPANPMCLPIHEGECVPN